MEYAVDLEFDRDVCHIRQVMSHVVSTLSWRKELEEVYHDVAWIIIAHNIWWNRLKDHQPEDDHLKGLKLPKQQYHDYSYKQYPINGQRYPLFTLFCLVDTIEPLKRKVHLEKINIEVFRGHIYLQVNKRRSKGKYVKAILAANDWLMPVRLLFDEIIDIECPKKYIEGSAGRRFTSITGKTPKRNS